ncbi:hypothetical protein ACIGO9_31490 [Nocardia asteroides]|uniref:hypothetical protein n=1 Tax=Nocardia asteroides TaxID=1824 RepID=UPI0037C7A15F
MSSDRQPSPRPQLPRDRAADAIARRLITPADRSHDGLDFWLSDGPDARQGESVGSVVSGRAHSSSIRWNSAKESRDARIQMASRLTLYRANTLSLQFGGYLLGRPDQTARTGDLLTYHLAIAVQLHDADGPIPWLGPVTAQQTRGSDNGIPPSLGRVLDVFIDIDTTDIPDPVSAMALTRERQQEIFGVHEATRDRPNDDTAALLLEFIARGEPEVPFPWKGQVRASWGEITPWIPDSLTNPPSPQVDILANDDDIALAARINAANLDRIRAHITGATAAGTRKEPWTREVLTLGSEVRELVASRLRLPLTTGPAPSGSSSHSRDFRLASDNSAQIQGYSEPGRQLRAIAEDPASSPEDLIAANTQLRHLREILSRDESVRHGAAQWLATAFLEHICGDLGAGVRVEHARVHDGRFIVDADIEVVFEDAAGSRISWHPPDHLTGSDPASKVLHLHDLSIDLSSLTPEQICAADDTWRFVTAPRANTEATLMSLRAAVGQDVASEVFGAPRSLEWGPFRERQRGSSARLIRVVANAEQIQEARTAAGWPQPLHPSATEPLSAVSASLAAAPQPTSGSAPMASRDWPPPLEADNTASSAHPELH